MSTGMAYVASGVVDVALDKLVLRVMDLWALNAPAATCDGVSTVIHWKSYSHDVPVVWELDMACFGTESLLTAETDGRYAVLRFVTMRDPLKLCGCRLRVVLTRLLLAWYGRVGARRSDTGSRRLLCACRKICVMHRYVVRRVCVILVVVALPICRVRLLCRWAMDRVRWVDRLERRPFGRIEKPLNLCDVCRWPRRIDVL